MNECVFLLLLAGSSSRFGQFIPKQYTRILQENNNNPTEVLFAYTANRILSEITVQCMLFVVAKEYIDTDHFVIPLNYLRKQYPNTKFCYTEGADTRHRSVISGINYLKNTHPNKDIAVAIHDANRPWLSNSFLKRIHQHLQLISEKQPCWIPVIPSVDSVCRIRQDRLEYLDRKEVYQVQTPQLVSLSSIYLALQRKKEKKRLVLEEWSDEGSFMSDMGFQVSSFVGEIGNRKITYASDLTQHSANNLFHLSS